MRWLVFQPGDAACNPVCLCNQVVAVLEQLRFAAVSALEHLLALNVLCNCVLSTRTHRVHVFIEALLQGRDGAALVKSHEVGDEVSMALVGQIAIAIFVLLRGVLACCPPPNCDIGRPTRALRQEGGFPTRTQRPSPIPHGPAMNPGQREHRRRELLDRRISPPLEESRRWAWWAETPVLVDAKPGGSPYVHCESTGKSGGSLRAHRNFPVFPL